MLGLLAVCFFNSILLPENEKQVIKLETLLPLYFILVSLIDGKVNVIFVVIVIVNVFAVIDQVPFF